MCAPAGGKDAAEDVGPAVRAGGLGPGAAHDAKVGLADAARHGEAAERARRGGVLGDEDRAGRLAVEPADEVRGGETGLGDEERLERAEAVAAAGVAGQVAALGDDGEALVLEQDPERGVDLRLRRGQREDRHAAGAGQRRLPAAKASETAE